MKKILIIEDDHQIARDLKALLEHANYNADILEDFANPLNQIQSNNYDLILLDINIPFISGDTLLKELRTQSNIPVIMVTSSQSEIDEVLCMSYGADDYIIKPYNPTILLLRIANIFRRMTRIIDTTSYKDLKINLSKGIVSNNVQEIILTKNELIIFSYLISNKERIVSRDELMSELWDNDEYINDNALTVNMSRLRNKLAELGYDEIIETRKGIGYLLK